MKQYILTLLLFLITIQINSDPIRKYKIVIDPGHGGVKQEPLEIFGDKYDTITRRFLENYKDGASYAKANRTEMEIVLGVGKELKEILDLTKTKKGFQKFKSYVKLFSDSEVPWIKIDSVMTRTDSYKDRNYREKEDKNQLYRLYDFPDFKTGKNRLGRISQINKEKPQLVVSLHINAMNSTPDSGGMGAVIAPSYQTFELLKRISEKKAQPEEFLKTPWKNWMLFESKWSRLENAMADAWIYFNGYWPTQDGSETNKERFEGYRANMITWRYRDDIGWEKKINKKEGPYAIDHSNFRAVGKFWDRERGKPELMRREGGPEGYGGDNLYASNELLRFLQYGLRMQVNEDKDNYKEPNKILLPFISTYSVPTYINAISAYLELGEITSDRDMYFVTTKKRKTAICLAVGIYSLFNGLEIKQMETLYTPKGKRIDFEKYIGSTGQSYFDEVTTDKNE
ncbi:MAG TPA: N-acetylmuramoyl-L-alanine amidase [Leptospiraceae bacterium]|nr:N-acetylmuramoyl-L-alanine amidase [Leptospiraceae bacterium]HMW07284.1 N-acetylmuramoyl-L-alanine amidase [Leptospiraceae bacterium]HMX33723.1 N-acetylmuramoyl-L-alanine amidase [Leptospiraceae bacterium]HMY32898.1 N-acetylmuramoyl-L-alanine amidase [Leptospiraceae bacterium]HMZ66640.1 N-acetylmuramoyl-L-alanine amidase [Leptospiraceae bacterium]